jgi:rhamnosyltransferase subunit B
VVDPPPDWPRSITVTSFVAWDRAEQHPVSPTTEAFLGHGEPPVLVTLGASSAVSAGDFFDQVTSEVVATGARALVITGPASPPSHDFDPDRVHVTAFVPFSTVARRCRAGIHHAGIGTTVAIMKAGIPQLAVPKGFDQPDTAAQIERLGIGIAIRWRQRSSHMRAAVRRLLDDGELRQRAAELGRRLAQEDGAPSSAAAIEAALSA